MKYLPSIGIETHVQLKTKTKLFSAVSNDARSARPNTLISHIDAGLPGALPVLNRAAVELSVKAGLALNGHIQSFSKFDRKHYFYPDLPKGYQISQYEEPIVLGGHVDISVGGQSKRIGLIRTHLEEDAGKNTHPSGADYSLIDLNRAGTPLLEIVSQPVINSPEEAKAYARELYLIMKYADVSDVDMYHGNLRFDINVSLSGESDKLGIRAEIKNLNSFRAVEAAADYEIQRQTELLERGEKVVQETRGWDEAKQKTTSQRGKEEAHDYRYMPEPDVPPIELSADVISRLKSEMPPLPGEIRSQLTILQLDSKVIEDLLDRPQALSHTLSVQSAGSPESARRTAFWFIHADDLELSSPAVEADRLIKLSDMVEEGTLSAGASRRVFSEMLTSAESPRDIAESLDLLQVDDQQEVAKFVDQVIADNPKAASDVKAGQEKAVGFLVGQVMSLSRGKANPGMAAQIIKDKLK